MSNYFEFSEVFATGSMIIQLEESQVCSVQVLTTLMNNPLGSVTVSERLFVCTLLCKYSPRSVVKMYKVLKYRTNTTNDVTNQINQSCVNLTISKFDIK